MIIHNENVIGVTDSGLTKVIADIEVSTVSQIPAPDGIDGRLLCEGTVVHAVSDGVIAKLDSDGSWYDISGNAVSPEAAEPETQQ